MHTRSNEYRNIHRAASSAAILAIIAIAGCGGDRKPPGGAPGTGATGGLRVPRQRVIDTLAREGTAFAMKEYREEGKPPTYSGLSNRYNATLTFEGPAENPSRASLAVPITGASVMEDGPKLALAGTFLRQFNPEAEGWMKRTLESRPPTHRFVETITLDGREFQLRCAPLTSATIIISLSVAPSA